MNEYKTWGLTETGNVFHSFKADGTAICRSNVKAGYMFRNHGGRTEAEVDHAHENNPHLFRKCASCVKKEAAHRARIEASMAPVNPYDQVCEGIETPEGARLAAGDACETVIDAEAMSQADDALAFAMADGVPGTEVACCEHAGMYHGARGCDECGCRVPRSARRAGNGIAEAAPVAESCNNCNWRMSSEGVCMNCRWDNGRSGQPNPRNGQRPDETGRNACPECGRRVGHKLDCSTGRPVSQQTRPLTEAQRLSAWLNAPETGAGR